MVSSTQSQIVASIVIFLGIAYIWAFSPPFYVTAIFTIVCIMWSAWILISVFRGTDEPYSASVRYALATASCVGIPLSVAFVVLMIATPAIQSMITDIAMTGRSGLSSAATGFGMGVVFTMIVLCAVFIISHVAWWASKR